MRGWLFLFSLSIYFSQATAKTTSAANILVSNNQFLRSTEPYFREGAASSLTNLNLRYQGSAERYGFFTEADLRDDFIGEEANHYFKPYTAVAGWQRRSVRLSLGRQKLAWSSMDEHWRLGLWQPRFTDDKITRETAGLIGAFFDIKQEKWSFSLLATPASIPERGPNFVIEEGKFLSKNPWFLPPTDRVELTGQEVPIRYRIERESTAELIQYAGASAQFIYHPTNEASVRVSHAYKPINQFLFGFPLVLNLTDPNYADVAVHPRRLYHQISTLEFGINDLNRWHNWWSLTREEIIRDKTPETWTTQEIGDATIASTYVGYDFRGEGPYRSRFYASYLRVLGGDGKDQGQYTGSVSLFERRFDFQDALQVGIYHFAPLVSGKWLMRLSTDFTYDFSQHGVVWSSTIRQPISRWWSAMFACDILGLVDTEGKVQNGFTANYRANDRVALGVEYVF